MVSFIYLQKRSQEKWTEESVVLESRLCRTRMIAAAKDGAGKEQTLAPKEVPACALGHPEKRVSLVSLRF